MKPCTSPYNFGSRNSIQYIWHRPASLNKSLPLPQEVANFDDLLMTSTNTY
jgi:hypothetical protein